MSISDRIVATIRTGVPTLVGLILAWLITKIPAVADILAFIDTNLAAVTGGVPVATVLGLAATAGIVSLYYYLARLAGSRWPAVEKWLLGQSLVPVYVAPGQTVVALPAPATVNRSEYQDAREAAGLD
jgi:uncharacterized membrane-anchored protein